MIWRDDDIGVDTMVATLAAIDDLFQKYQVPHTIAVMAAGMDKRPDLVRLIRERGMLVQLHCWTHLDLTTRPAARGQLAQAADLLADLFGYRPTVLYPPWNRCNAAVIAAATAIGLTVSSQKITLQQFIRAGGDVCEDVINFHHWFPPEALQLEPALRLATRAT